MAVTTATDDEGKVTQTITGTSKNTKATVSATPGEPSAHEPSRIQFIVQGNEKEKVPDLTKSGLAAGAEPSTNGVTGTVTHTVGAKETPVLLEKLGLPKDLGGAPGVRVEISYNAKYNTSQITIESRDVTGKTHLSAEHIDTMAPALTKQKGALPPELREAVIKDNPGLAARIVETSRSHGGTHIDIRPVEAGNLAIKVGHDAATHTDTIKLPTNTSKDQMVRDTQRVTEHLRAHGIAATNNIEAINHAASVVTHPADIPNRVGAPTVSVPAGQGEKALAALSQKAEYKIDGNPHYSAPVVPKEIAQAATPHVAEVRAAMSIERSVVKGMASSLPAKLAVGGAMAAVGGIAAAAEAPQGHRVEAGMAATKKIAMEQMVPGSTETDTCKKVGAQVGMVGGVLGASAGFAASTGATTILAVPTLGASVAASPITVTATTVGGGILGNKIGEMLGEGGCNLVRSAVNAMSSDNRAQVAHKPDEQKVATTKAPDSVPQPAKAVGAAAGRG